MNPARLIQTDREWSDLVLPAAALQQLEEVKCAMAEGKVTCLFHGPPGSGKALTASLLGKHSGADVMLVSKYVAETEKNLERVFARAEEEGAILLFDEADALFGPRTSVDDAHDRYANLDVNYLLQRLEAFDGLVILTSNLKPDLDAAFLRRCDCVIEFPRREPAP